MITKKELEKMTIKEIKASSNLEDAFISLLEEDKRAGVQKIAQALRKKQDKQKQLILRTQEKQRFDQSYLNSDITTICGVDEVGRGPLAGPVVTAAVILPKEPLIIGVDDSKSLSQRDREELAKEIKEKAISYAYGVVSPEHIDEINILNATKRAMYSAIKRLDPKPDLVLIDAVKLNSGIPEVSIIKGDTKSYSIGAASIIAKVKRDQYMAKMAHKYPEYDFDKNMGYGTKKHIEAIKKYGLTPIHRRTFCKNF